MNSQSPDHVNTGVADCGSPPVPWENCVCHPH